MAMLSLAVHRLSLVAVRGLLTAVASLVAEHSFRHAGSVAVACGFSSCGLQALECRLSSCGKDFVALRHVESSPARNLTYEFR